MKSYTYSHYGPPEVLSVVERQVPVPTDNEVLVRVHATTVNRTDSGFLTGLPKFARIFIGWPRPRAKTLGCEFSGVVEAVGEGEQQWKPGDRVFGYSDWAFGGHSEYVLCGKTHLLARIPDTISFEQAACASEGAHYALCNLRVAGVGKSSRVLVNGATGAIGSAAVQLAKFMGAEVTAVCATPHMELVRSLGADHVVDYTAHDFTALSGGFDFVFDAVGKSTFGRCKRLLKPKGIYISTELGPGSQNPFLALITPLFGGRRLKFPIPVTRQEDMDFLRDRLSDGSFKPVIDRVVEFKKIPEAFAYVLTGQKIGNVVVKVREA